MKKLLLLVLTLVMVLSAYTVSFAAAKKIGISMPTQSLERWNRDGQYLKAQFDSAGYETQLTYSDNKNASLLLTATASILLWIVRLKLEYR